MFNLARPRSSSSARCLFLFLVAGPLGAQRTLYVDDDGSPSGTGTLADPFSTIQAAVDASATGDLVHVLPGTYTQGVVYRGKEVTVKSMEGPEVTIIEPSVGRGATFVSGEFWSSVLEGFTIRNGRARIGAGIYCEDSSPIVRGCIVEGNVSNEEGGGIACVRSAAQILDCVVRGNTSLTGEGGGLYFRSLSFLCVDRSLVLDNRAESSTVGFGGGILLQSAAVGITNCVVAGNVAAGVERNAGGGIMCNGLSTLGLFDSVVADNDVLPGTVSNGVGGGIYLASNSSAFVTTSILWGNQAFAGPQLWAVGSVEADFNDVEGGETDIGGGGSLDYGAGNISADPLFVDPAQRDYHVQPGSPVVDAGRMGGFGLDGDGDPRPLDGDRDGNQRLDMGWDEVNPTSFEVVGAPVVGGSLSLRTSGPTGNVFVHLMGAQPVFHPFAPYGSLLVGNPLMLVGSGTVPGATNLGIPASPSLVGLELYFQSLAREVGVSVGALSRRIPVTIR